jgi:hypothetical protein
MLKREVLAGIFSYGSRKARSGLLGARGRPVGLVAATAALLGLWAVALAGSAAAAATPCGNSSVFSYSGTTVTCTYSTAGTEGTLTVPANVSSVHVVADGSGGGGNFFHPGGAGAQVTSDLNVTPGSTLFVEVDIGGGLGANFGFNGGGESDVRTCSISDSQCPAAGSAQDPRLVVAGGGGGAGASGGGGSGGPAGVGTATCNPGGDGTHGSVGITGGPGIGGGCTSGGKGGTGGAATDGGTGTASSGGNGGIIRGGGGGAGFWGGGGGGGGSYNGGGGGGGSSFGPTGSVFAYATIGASVAISFTLTPSELAALILAIDSTGVAPGTALIDKATAIQAAVNVGDTATACADITDYLGLVKAQTSKKLSAGNVTPLTTDANNLAAALGC